MSDGWAAYKNLNMYGYIHKIELHNRGFLLEYPNSTNPVERYWGSIKRLLKQYCNAFTEKSLYLFISEGTLRRRSELLQRPFLEYL